MEVPEFLTPLLMVLSIALALWLCLPALLVLLRFTGVRSGVIGGPESIEIRPRNAVPEELCRRLKRLGFSAAGTTWEGLPGHKKFREYVFGCQAGDCFAKVYQLWENDPPRAAFMTTFQDGAVVLTQNYQGGMTVDEETFCSGSLPQPPEELRHSVAEVLEEHRRRVRRFVTAGHIIATGSSVDDSLEAKRAYYNHPRARQQVLSGEAHALMVKAEFLIGGPGLTGAIYGFNHVVPWAVLLALGLAILLLRHYGYPLVALLQNPFGGAARQSG